MPWAAEEGGAGQGAAEEGEAGQYLAEEGGAGQRALFAAVEGGAVQEQETPHWRKCVS